MKLLNFNKVLCLSPHPDDVEYSMSGTIIKSKNTHFDILCLTNGGNFDLTTEKNRKKEVSDFWKSTNINNCSTFFSPHKLLKTIDTDEWINYIEKNFIKKNKYDCIFLPSQLDSHFEHEIVSKFGYALIRNTSTSLIEYCSPSTLDIWIPNFFIDISEIYKIKVLSLEKFQTQLHRNYFNKTIIDGFHVYFPQSKKELKKIEKFKVQQLIIK